MTISSSLAGAVVSRRVPAVALMLCNVGATLAFIIWAKSQLVEGHNWGDDFGLYLQMADNIRSGHPLNYLNTLIRVPPGFPLILAGWEDLFGQSFVALKSLNIAAWVIAAWIAYILACKIFGPVTASLVLVAHFLTPAYYHQQQNVLSDIPFVATVNLLMLFCVIYFRDAQYGTRTRILLLYAIPVLLFAALLIRPAGLPFVGAIVLAALFEAFRNRRNRVLIVRPVALALLVLISFGIYLIVFGASTGDQLTNALRGIAGPNGSLILAVPRLIATRAGEELINLKILVTWYPVEIWLAIVIVLGVVLGALAYVIMVREFVLPLFLVTYTAFILLIPWQAGYRYLLPMISIIFILFVSPLKLFIDTLRRSAGWKCSGAIVGLTAALLFMGVLGTGMAHGVRALHRFSDDETSDPRTKALIDWLKQNTTVNDTLCSFKPRAIMYFVGRRTCYIPNDLSMEIGAYLKSEDSFYAILILRSSRGYEHLDELFRISGALTEVFRNEDYVVYKRRR